jgi:hypothetical protein
MAELALKRIPYLPTSLTFVAMPTSASAINQETPPTISLPSGSSSFRKFHQFFDNDRFPHRSTAEES